MFFNFRKVQLGNRTILCHDWFSIWRCVQTWHTWIWRSTFYSLNKRFLFNCWRTSLGCLCRHWLWNAAWKHLLRWRSWLLSTHCTCKMSMLWRYHWSRSSLTNHTRLWNLRTLSLQLLCLLLILKIIWSLTTSMRALFKITKSISVKLSFSCQYFLVLWPSFFLKQSSDERLVAILLVRLHWDLWTILSSTRVHSVLHLLFLKDGRLSFFVFFVFLNLHFEIHFWLWKFRIFQHFLVSFMGLTKLFYFSNLI